MRSAILDELQKTDTETIRHITVSFPERSVAVLNKEAIVCPFQIAALVTRPRWDNSISHTGMLSSFGHGEGFSNIPVSSKFPFQLRCSVSY